MNAAPKWGTCGGKDCIKVLTLCHNGTHHNAAFDPETHKITCFSECNTTTMIHTWVCKVLGTTNPNEGRQFIEKWIDEAEIDLSDVIPGASGGTKTYHVFDPDKKVDMVKGIDPKILADLYSRFDTTPQTLSLLKWHLLKARGGDEIPLQQLIDFDVAYYPKRGTIILPHHNINGEIVGLYERSFAPTRDEMEKIFQYGKHEWIDNKEIWKAIHYAPKSKYMPLWKEKEY